MRKKLIFLYCIINTALALDPRITSWIKYTGTGYGGITNNVEWVKYSTNYVYVHSQNIPAYSIGPWPNNPNTPAAKNFTFKFPLNSVVTSTKQKNPAGHMGLLINGQVIYGPGDGMSYKNQGVWNQNGGYFELSSFDKCNGHPDKNGEYHNHLNPICLYSSDAAKHSPIIGFAFDGFPIYGPFGYNIANNPDSGIIRMKASYRKRNLTNRKTLSNGTVLNSNFYGPDVSSVPLGAYLEDYEYVSNLGDLDEHNGRYGKTPEFPNGVYAYFVGTDSNNNPVYPYFIGPYYYGVALTPQASNIGPNSGKNQINEQVISYF